MDRSGTFRICPLPFLLMPPQLHNPSGQVRETNYQTGVEIVLRGDTDAVSKKMHDRASTDFDASSVEEFEDSGIDAARDPVGRNGTNIIQG